MESPNFNKTTPPPQDENNPWDMSDVVNPHFQPEQPQYKEDVQYWGNEYRDIEKTFANYHKNITNPKDPKYLENLAYYEEDAAHIWQSMESATDKALQHGDFADTRYDVDHTQNIVAVSGENSIEAATGALYFDREHQLLEAINDLPDSPEIAADRDTVRQTWRMVNNYFTIAAYDRFSAERTKHHNKMIQHLNKLNQLTEKYHTKRFTFRDFRDTDHISYLSEKDPYGRTDNRYYYDRYNVAGYFRTAFSREFDEITKRAAEDSTYSSL